MSTTAAPTGIVYNIPEVNFGTTTSWVPLTTPYPSSSGCASSFFLFPGQAGVAAWDPGYGYFGGGQARCLPPAETAWWEQNHQAPDGFTSLSIRPIVCPAAFTTAVTSIQSVSSTLVLCCPSGYDWQHGEPGQPNAGTCLSSVKSGQVLTYLGSFSGGFAETSITVSSSSSVSAIGLLGWNVATTTSGAPSQPTTSGSSNTTQASGGLSPGAKAGIGVSAAIGGIGIIALICAVFLLRRRPKVSEYAAAPPAEPEWRPVQPIHEMGTNQKTAELPVFR